ncbi:MAG: alpha/beta fold hydrolase [Shimia sp.]
MITTAAGRLHVRDDGAGLPLVVWPSVFTDGHVYDRLAPLLDGVRTIRIDGPGHGGSGPPTAGLDMTMCGQAIIDVMDALGVEDAVVGGTSWGGIAAAEAAAIAPGRARGLILMNTPLWLGETTPSLMTRFVVYGAGRLNRMKFYRDGVARSFFADPTLGDAGDYATHFHRGLAQADPKSFAGAIRAVLLEAEPLAPRLAGIAAPTLMIAGEEDDMYPAARMEGAANTMPDATFRVVPGKHISPIDATDRVAAEIAAFLARLH